MVKYLISYTSSIITLVNASVIFLIIRLTSSSVYGEQLAELIFLVGLFPVIALGYPTLIIADVSRWRRLDKIIIYSAYRYMLTSSVLVCMISYIFFKEVWWFSSAYPVVFVVSLIRGYFEAFERFWLSACSKLFVLSVLLASASQLVLREFSPYIFVTVCIGLAVLLMILLYRKSVYTEKRDLNLSRYSLQAVVVLSFLFMDRSLMKFIADSDSYVSFIITQEALYRIMSLFMLISVFHFPELNSENKSIRQHGLNAYKWQLLIAFFSIVIFVLTPINEIFFEILLISTDKFNLLMLPALFLPIMSMLLQKIALSQLSNDLVRVFVYTVAVSSVVGSMATYFLQDPVASMASRGAIEALILVYFIRKHTNIKKFTN